MKLFLRLAATITMAVALVSTAPAAAAQTAPSSTIAQDDVSIMAFQIGPGIGSCPYGYFCVWYGAWHTGPGYAWSGNDADWRNNYFSNGQSVNNNAASWWNNGSPCPGCDHVKVYDGVNYSGLLVCYIPQGGSGYNPPAANRGSSHSWAARC